jgi:hypothetical protein
MVVALNFDTIYCGKNILKNVVKNGFSRSGFVHNSYLTSFSQACSKAPKNAFKI